MEKCSNCATDTGRRINLPIDGVSSVFTGVAVDPATHLVYFPLENVGAMPSS